MDNIWYTAVEPYGPHTKYGEGFSKYVEYSKFYHVKEIVSLDSMLCPALPVLEENKDWDKVVNEDRMDNMYTDLDYVKHKVGEEPECNLLAVVREPDELSRKDKLGDFEFIGYDLVDREMIASALTNCGGFDESFNAEDLNKYGLLDERENAYRIREKLAINNPDEHHADCWVFEVWRMKNK